MMMMMMMKTNVMPVGTVRMTTGSSAPQESRPGVPKDGVSTAERPQRTASSASLWRPWTSVRNKALSCPYSRPPSPSPPSALGCSAGQMKPHSFQHPVRLMWPRSKTFDFLYNDGAMLLRNFPVQATICFYEESDSEEEEDEEEEEEEEEEDKCTKALRHHHFTTRN